MTPEEKKLEKLNKLFELVNEEYATPDDLIAFSEAILGIVQTQKAKIDGEIATATGKVSQEVKQAQGELQARVLDLQNIINRLTYQTEQGIAQVDRQLTKTLDTELKRLERKIPTKTDLTGLESDIQAIKSGLNNLPTEFTINNEAIRDGLELLQGNERLDRTAIKGLDDWEEIVALARTPRSQAIAGVRLLRYLADVNIDGITNGQTIVWNATTGKFEPGSAGAGGGHTIEDEGTPLTQRTNLNFVGAGVTVTDDAGNDRTVVTIPSATGTLQTVTDAGSTTTNDVEITDTTKGVILKSADGTRWRIGITNGGALTAVTL